MARKFESKIPSGRSAWVATVMGTMTLGVGAASVLGAGLLMPSAASASATQTSAATQASSSAVSAGTVTTAARKGVLSGKRRVAIVRTDAFESGVGLTSKRLIEADDDSGRQLFVPTPLGKGELGDAKLTTFFALVDNGPAPA